MEWDLVCALQGLEVWWGRKAGIGGRESGSKHCTAGVEWGAGITNDSTGRMDGTL